MFVVGIGEIVVVLVLRPLRFLLGGQRTPMGRGLLRFERWLLYHLHVMGAESHMRDELGRHGNASSFLASGLSDQSGTIGNVNDTVQRVRSQTGADQHDSLERAQRDPGPELRRGQRHVESRGGDRSDDIHQAMLQAQRQQNQQAERARRRRG